jgi:hypothetical protein
MHSFDSLGAPSAIIGLLWFLAHVSSSNMFFRFSFGTATISKSFGQSAAKMYAAAYFLSPGNP